MNSPEIQSGDMNSSNRQKHANIQKNNGIAHYDFKRRFAIGLVYIVLLLFCTFLFVSFFCFSASGVSDFCSDPAQQEDIFLFGKRFWKAPTAVERLAVVIVRDPDQNLRPPVLDMFFRLSKVRVLRAIGLPGEHVRVTSAGVWINGKELEEPYKVKQEAGWSEQEPGEAGFGAQDFRLASNQYLMLGDDREFSYDSRFFGPITADYIVGVPLLVLTQEHLIRYTGWASLCWWTIISIGINILILTRRWLIPKIITSFLGFASFYGLVSSRFNIVNPWWALYVDWSWFAIFGALLLLLALAVFSKRLFLGILLFILAVSNWLFFARAEGNLQNAIQNARIPLALEQTSLALKHHWSLPISAWQNQENRLRLYRADILRLNGRFSEALSELEKVNKLATSSDQRYESVLIEATVRYQQGLHDEAQRLIKNLPHELPYYNGSELAARVTVLTALLQYEAGDISGAFALLNSAKHDFPYSPEAIVLSGVAGRLSIDLGNYSDSYLHLRKCEAYLMQHRGTNPILLGAMDCGLGLVRTLAAAGFQDTAANRAASWTQLAAAIGLDSDSYKALLTAGEILEHKDPKAALWCYQTGLLGAAALGDQISDDLAAVAFGGNSANYYDRALDLLLPQNKADGINLSDLIYLIEESRAKSLRLQMARNHIVSEDRLPADLNRDIQGIRAEINAAVSAYVQQNQKSLASLSNRETGQSTGVFTQTVFYGEMRRNERLKAFYSTYPLVAYRYFPRPAEISEIARFVENGEALILLRLTEKHLVRLIIQKKSRATDVIVRFDEKALNRNSVRKAIRALLSEIRIGKYPDIYQLGTLSRDIDLLKGIDPSIHRLLLVPDDVLLEFPLELLQTNSGFISDRFDTTYYPSATIMVMIRRLKLRPTFPSELLAIGVIPYGYEVAPSADADNISLERRAILRQAVIYHFDVLPASRQELQDVQDIFQKHNKQVRLVMNDEARDDYLREMSSRGDLAKFRFWLFSGHAILDDLPGIREPALVLAHGSGPSRNIGFLKASEINELNIGEPELVFLSACQTALGKGGQPVRGEGMVGLARSFLLAGSESVVGSLWNVSDEASAAFSHEFFSALSSGYDKYAALRIARTKIRKRPEYKFPREWSAFVLIGGRGSQ
jgi:signal peptidase I